MQEQIAPAAARVVVTSQGFGNRKELNVHLHSMHPKMRLNFALTLEMQSDLGFYVIDELELGHQQECVKPRYEL